jgi:hypothetical protein
MDLKAKLILIELDGIVEKVSPKDFKHLSQQPGARILQLDKRTSDAGYSSRLALDHQGNSYFIRTWSPNPLRLTSQQI